MMGGAGGHSAWMMMRGFSRDPNITKQRIKPGTVRRNPRQYRIRWVR